MFAKRKNRSGESKHSLRRLESVERQLKATQYRRSGLTYSQIAAVMNLNSPQAAWYCVNAAMARTLSEPKELARRLDLGRLDSLFATVFARASRGDSAAITAAISIMVGRAKLLGVDSPVSGQNEACSVQPS